MSLKFFNSLQGVLDITLTKKSVSIGNLLNQKALPEAKIKKLSLELEAPGEEEDRELTEKELNTKVINSPKIKMISSSLWNKSDIAPHSVPAPNGKFFTVKDLIYAIEKTEKIQRANSEWFGGVDVHHVYFEGIYLEKGIWRISWGS